MKRLASILFLLLAFNSAHAADLVVSNNAIIVFFGDSWTIDTSHSANVTGYRVVEYLHSYFALNYPTSNIAMYNGGRSGTTMDITLTNSIQKFGVPLWGYQSNLFQKIGFLSMTDNGGLGTNEMVNAVSNACLAPAVMSDGAFPLTTQSGYTATMRVQWVAVGEPPLEGSGPDTAQRTRNNATTNAGWTFGARGVDGWNTLSPSWFSDYTANGGTNVEWFASPGGHFASGGALSWAMAIIKGITTDTNISTCTLDWNSSTPSATNHCVVSSIANSGSTLTFTRHDDRLPMAFDVADGIITNDAQGAFNLIPGDASYFHFDLQITNLPAGNYSVAIDGTTVAASLSSTVLASGWNMFTNYSGPYWNQRKEVLGRIRDQRYVNRVTLVSGSAGDQVGEIAYGSAGGTPWDAGARGDLLIASNNAAVAKLQTNVTSVNFAATPTNHTFSITLNQPRFAPFRR